MMRSISERVSIRLNSSVIDAARAEIRFVEHGPNGLARSQGRSRRRQRAPAAMASGDASASKVVQMPGVPARSLPASSGSHHDDE